MSEKRVFLFLGGDGLQKEKAIQALCRHYYKDEPVERIKFSGKSDPLGNLLEELHSYSIFSENRFVIVEPLFPIPKKDSGKEGSAYKTFLECLTSPRGDTPLLLFAETRKDVQKAILDAIPPKQVKTLEKTSPAMIREMLIQRCAEKTIRMEPAAVTYFMQLCGEDAEIAVREIHKILLWAGEGGQVTLDDCQLLLQTEHEMDIWEVTNAVAAKNHEGTIRALHDLFTHGDEPIAIIARLGGTFRSMYQCKAMEADKIPFAQWSQKSGMQEYRLKKIKEQMPRFSLPSLRKAIHCIRQADADVKGGKCLPRLVVERLAIELCTS